MKLNPDCSIDRYKTRSIAKGCTQVVGVDYYDSFSLVAKIVIVILFLASKAAR